MVAANERSSGGVEGLEIVVCDTAGVHGLSDNEAPRYGISGEATN